MRRPEGNARHGVVGAEDPRELPTVASPREASHIGRPSGDPHAITILGAGRSVVARRFAEYGEELGLGHPQLDRLKAPGFTQPSANRQANHPVATVPPSKVSTAVHRSHFGQPTISCAMGTLLFPGRSLSLTAGPISLVMPWATSPTRPEASPFQSARMPSIPLSDASPQSDARHRAIGVEKHFELSAVASPREASHTDGRSA